MGIQTSWKVCEGRCCISSPHVNPFHHSHCNAASYMYGPCVWGNDCSEL